jgi:hypothetical protein
MPRHLILPMMMTAVGCAGEAAPPSAAPQAAPKTFQVKGGRLDPEVAARPPGLPDVPQRPYAPAPRSR